MENSLVKLLSTIFLITLDVSLYINYNLNMTTTNKNTATKGQTMIDITNLTDTGIDTVLRIAARETFTLPIGLSNADLDAVKAAMVRNGCDAVRVGRWLCDYMADQRRAGRLNRGR